MKKILFVDDEKNILMAMKRQMHPYREKWKCFFAEDAETALAVLNSRDINVIVSDVIMPHTNGLELLKKVSVKYPEVFRIILSGQVNEDMAMDCMRVSHQVFAKPYDVNNLIQKIDDLVESEHIISNSYMRDILSNITNIPPVPSTLLEINNTLKDPEATITDVGEIISQDPAVSAGLLKLVNSPFFSLRNDIYSTEKAVALLGIETIKAFIINNYLLGYFKLESTDYLDIEKLKKHLFIVSLLSKSISQGLNLSKESQEIAITASLMHDIGKLILLANIHDRYVATIKETIRHDRPLWEMERECLGYTHAEVGAYLFSIWGMPKELTEAILYHHTPNLSPNKEINSLVPLHIANVFEHNLINYGEHRPERKVDQTFLERFDLNSKIETILTDCRNICEEVKMYE